MKPQSWFDMRIAGNYSPVVTYRSGYISIRTRESWLNIGGIIDFRLLDLDVRMEALQM